MEKEEGRDITNVRDVTLLQIFVQLTEEEAQKQAEGKKHSLICHVTQLNKCVCDHVQY